MRDQAGSSPSSPLVTRCAWCGLIKGGECWHAERRKREVKYTHGICPDCHTGFRAGSVEPA